VLEAMGPRTDVRVVVVDEGLGPEARLEALEREAVKTGAVPLFVDARDLNREAKIEFLRALDAADLDARRSLRLLVDGRTRFADLTAAEQDAVYRQIVGLLPRMAPRSIEDFARPLGDAEEAWQALKFRLFHPSFGDALTGVTLDARAPYAALWSLGTILKDPLFLKSLKDRDLKIRRPDGSPAIRDYAVMTHDDFRTLERTVLDRLGDRGYADFMQRFGDNFVLVEPGESLSAAFAKLDGLYAPEHVFFVDTQESPILRRDASRDGELGLLRLEGPFALTLDKLVVRLLAAGGKWQSVAARGLTFRDGILIFHPILPIDYMRKLREFYLSASQTAQAA
jgi:hypothetical protein